MEKILKVLLLGLILAVFILGLFVIVNLENKEPIEKTRTVFVGTVTKELSVINFNVTYKGNCPEYYSDYAIRCIVNQTILEKNIFEILKQDSLEKFLKDTLEYEITSIDPTFKVLSIETEYRLRLEVQELWNEYMNLKIEAAKIEEKARNLEILYEE